MSESIKIPVECTFSEDGLKGALEFVADLQKKYDDLESECKRVLELVINLEQGIAPTQIMCDNLYLQEVTKYLLKPSKDEAIRTASELIKNPK